MHVMVCNGLCRQCSCAVLRQRALSTESICPDDRNVSPLVKKTNAVDEANLELIFEQSVAQFFFTYRLGSFGMFRTLNDPSLAEVAC